MSNYRNYPLTKDPAYYDALEAALDRRFYGCDPGRSVFAAPAVEPDSVPASIGAFPTPHDHGSNSRYTAGCRCNVCRAAHARATRFKRQQAKA